MGVSGSEFWMNSIVYMLIPTIYKHEYCVLSLILEKK